MIWCRALLLIFLALPVTAQEVRSLAPIDQAKYLIAIGLLKDAEDVLGRFLEIHPDDIEARFLEATIAAEETRWSDAIKWYRGILSQHPDLLRVRLDYARALFEDGQDEEADYNFRLALPDVPEAAAANIYGYLNQIETRKRFTYGLSIGGSLDSDINAAPAVSQLTLFGLPFTLSPGNRATSGVGVIVNGSAEYRLPLAEDPWQLRLRFGGGLYRAEYFGGHSRFDDMIARVYSGPQLLFDKGDVSLLGVANMRWYGNDPYNWGYGPRAEIRYSLTNRILLQAGLEYTPDWYHTQTFENGQLLTGLATTSYVISPASFRHRARARRSAGFQQSVLPDRTRVSARAPARDHALFSARGAPRLLRRAKRILRDNPPRPARAGATHAVKTGLSLLGLHPVDHIQLLGGRLEPAAILLQTPPTPHRAFQGILGPSTEVRAACMPLKAICETAFPQKLHGGRLDAAAGQPHSIDPIHSRPNISIIKAWLSLPLEPPGQAEMAIRRFISASRST